jgi:hypothetical protein
MSNLEILVKDEDRWSIAEGENEDGPFIVRFRPHLQSFAETKDYNKRLIIMWPYESEDNAMMPNDTDTKLMEAVENNLVEALENDVLTVLAFVYTGQNQKEWHWYTLDIAETSKRINEALADFDKLPIELEMEDDENWNEYKAVIEGAE